MITWYEPSHSSRILVNGCQVNCVGQRPNSGLIEALSAESVSESGHVKVQPTLQITGPLFTRTYAAGDVIESDGVKNARGAIEQAEVVAENIVRALHSQKQIEYHVRWWEGMTRLSVGLVRQQPRVENLLTKVE